MLHFLLIDDHTVVRGGMRFVLTQLFQPCHIEEAANEEQVVEKIKEKAFDLLIMDINMPGTNTLGLLKFIIAVRQEAKVLMFSMNDEKLHAKRYLDAGAKGFLSKE